MRSRKGKIYIIITVVIFAVVAVWAFKRCNFNLSIEVGEVVDSFNGVAVYYNGGVANVTGRNTAPDGYNIGLKYQCVEFVKRYYYEYLNHKMPDSYGHAKDFFNNKLRDGEVNPQRGLLQYRNPSTVSPEVNDIIVFKGTVVNKYGHVAIVSSVTDSKVEIIQQNPGPFGKSRETFSLNSESGVWRIDNDRILGWLRKN